MPIRVRPLEWKLATSHKCSLQTLASTCQETKIIELKINDIHYTHWGETLGVKNDYKCQM